MANQTEERRVKIIADGSATTATLTQMRAAARLLNKELETMPRNTAEFTNKAADLRNINATIKQTSAEVRGLESSSKSFWKNVGTIGFGSMIGNFATGAVSMITNFVSSMVSGSAKMSDALAGVQKTTGMTKSEVAALNHELGEFNTRTARAELLKMAQEAGKLGYSTVEDVKAFVKVADMVNVALGEDLGQDGIINIGKINELFKETQRLGIEKSYTATASAINSLGQAGTASEAYIVDFTKRLAGIAVQADITNPNVLGLGATLDELGQTSEVSSTSLTHLFVDMKKNSETYAKAAGLNLKEFVKVLGKDTNEAFIMFLEGINKNSDGLQGLAKRFDDVNIDGTRSIGVLAALSQNTEKLREKQKFANEEYLKGNSILKEFNTQNETFGAKVDKLGKAFYGFLINNPISAWVQSVVGGLADLVVGTKTTGDALEEQIEHMDNMQVAFNEELEMLKNTNIGQEDRARLIKEVNDKYADYLPNLISEKDTLTDINAAQEYGNKLFLARTLLMRHQDSLAELGSKRADAYEKKFALQRQLSKYSEEKEFFNPTTKKFEKSWVPKDAQPGDDSFISPGALKEMMDKYWEYIRIMDVVDGEIKAQNGEFKLMLGDLDVTMDQVLGKSKTIVKTPGGTPIAGDIKAPKAAKDDMEKRTRDEFNEREQVIKYMMEAEQAFIMNQYADGIISKDAYEKGLTDIETHYLQIRKVNYIDYGEDTAALDKDLAEVKIKAKEKAERDSLQIEKEAIKESKELKKSNAEFAQRYLNEGNAERIEMELQYLDELMNAEIANTEYTEHQKQIIREYYADEKRKLVMRGVQKEINTFGELANGVMGVYTNINDFITQMQNAELSGYKMQSDEKVKTLDAQLNQGLISEDEYNKQKEAIENEYREKERDIKQRAWMRQKSADYAQAGINMALGITRALASAPPPVNFIMAGLTAAASGVQLAMIQGQPMPEFAWGGVTGKSGRRYNANNAGSFSAGGAYNSTSFGIIGEKGPELVVPNWLYSHPQMVDTMGAIEASINSRRLIGGYNSTTTGAGGTDTGAIAAAMDKNTAVMMALMKKLDEPILAHTNFSVQEYDRFNDLLAKSSLLSKV